MKLQPDRPLVDLNRLVRARSAFGEPNDPHREIERFAVPVAELALRADQPPDERRAHLSAPGTIALAGARRRARRVQASPGTVTGYWLCQSIGTVLW